MDTDNGCIQAVFEVNNRQAIVWTDGRLEMRVGGVSRGVVAFGDVNVACRRALRWTGMHKARAWWRQFATGRENRDWR